MMRKLVLVVITIVWCITSTLIVAQDFNKGGHETTLVLQTKSDTTRVIQLNKQAYSSLKENTEVALQFLNEALQISEIIGYDKGKANSLFIKGELLLTQSNNKEAIVNFHEALALYERLDVKRDVVLCYAKLGLASYYDSDYNEAIKYYKKSISLESNELHTKAISLKYLGYCYEDLGNSPKAQEYYENALNINIKNNNQIEVANCYLALGGVFLRKANYPLSLKYSTYSLEVSEAIKDTLGISKALNNIGIVYKNYEKYDKAIINFERSLAIQRKIGSKRNVAKALDNIGSVYLRKGNHKAALGYYKKSLAISDTINDKYNYSKSLIKIGSVYGELEQYNTALEYFEKSKEISEKIGYKLGVTNAYRVKAITYTKQKRYEEALYNAKKAQELSNQLGILTFQREIAQIISTINENTGNFKEALSSYQIYKTLNDSLFNKENIEKITALEYEYKYKQQLDSASIRELKLNKTIVDTSENLAKTQRNYLWAIIGALLLAIVSGAIIFYQKYKNIKTKNQNIITEQRLLRSQMTPHFIFNSLAVLQGMILNKEEKKSVSYLSKFSKLLRTILENSRDKTVLLSQELEAVNNYLSLHTIESNTYDYSLTISDHIKTDTFKIPPMLIQPFIENAIEHAFPINQGDKKITVDVRLEGDNLQCVIIDNGVGVNSTMRDAAFAKAENKSKSSLATTITEERLQILSKDFNVKGNLVVEDRSKYEEQGTKVTLTLPYKTIAA